MLDPGEIFTLTERRDASFVLITSQCHNLAKLAS